MKKSIGFIVLMVIVDALLFFLLTRLSTPLWHLFGSDVIEYENWFGEMEDTIRYRFGVGSFEFLFVVVKAIIIFLIEIRRIKAFKGKKALIVIAGVIHGILLCLQVAYVAIFMDGREIISYLSYLFD